MNAYAILNWPDDAAKSLLSALGARVESHNGGLYVNGNELTPICVGDTVMIRGDLRINYLTGKCMYFPEQLVDGKYVKHASENRPWTGKVSRIDDDMAFVGGMWRNVSLLEAVRPEQLTI